MVILILSANFNSQLKWDLQWMVRLLCSNFSNDFKIEILSFLIQCRRLAQYSDWKGLLLLKQETDPIHLAEGFVTLKYVKYIDFFTIDMVPEHS